LNKKIEFIEKYFFAEKKLKKESGPKNAEEVITIIEKES
jgi:hypothetical protein